MLVPVPGDVEDVEVLEDLTLIDRVDRYAGPRLVSLTCEDLAGATGLGGASASTSFGCSGVARSIQDQLLREILDQVSGQLGLDLSFGAGDYDIEVLAPGPVEELGVWAAANGWALDPDAAGILARQVRHDTKYLAVKVDLDDGLPVGRQMLKPIRFSYHSDSFSLPIELGAAHAEEVQDVVLHVITDSWDGQVGVSNYPEFDVEAECLFRDEFEDFTEFYARQIKQGYHAVGGEAAWTTEYVWAPAKCDPCPEEGPLDEETLRAVGYEGDVGQATLTRIRARFHPEFVRGDLALYGSGLAGQQQLRYVLHDPALESDFPVCEEGWSLEPGSCDDEPVDPMPAGGGPALPAGALAVALLTALRRKMERAISHT
jgi:hypothetical protein